MSSASACKRIFTIRNERPASSIVHCAWQKSPGGLLASSVEGSPFVLIHERQGKLVEKLSIPASCVGMSWDEDGDILAIIVDHPGVLLLWEVHSSKLQEIDTGMKDIGSCISWSKNGKILCFASQKGNILIYNHRNLRRIPIIGKHSKRIICVQWSNDTLLALGTTDNFLSVNTMDGDTIKNFQLRGKPSDLQFGHIKEDRSNSAVDNTVSAIVGEKTLYLLKFDDGQGSLAPMELGFQARYGNLVTHHWHGDGYILVTFSAGFVVLLSSHYKEIGTELVLCELKAEPLRHACLNTKLSRLAVCFGDSMIQIHDATDPKAIVNTTDIADEDGRVRPAIRCSWTIDGQLLAVVNASGDIGVFLTSVPMLGSYNWNQVAAMSSLTDVVLYGFNEGQLVQEFTYNLDFEPSLIVLGPYYLAACLNNKAWFYACQEFHTPPSNQAVACKEFNSNIQELVINADYCAARCGDRAYLCQIEGDGMDMRGMKTFPEQQSTRSFRVTCLCMTKDVFLYGGENGLVRIFHLDSWCEIIQLQSPAGVVLKSIHPNFNGIFFVMIDKHCQGFFYNIDEDVMTPIPNFPTRVDGVLWDTEYGSRHIFLAYSLTSTKIQVYVTWRQVLIGEPLHQVGTFQWFQTSEHRPLCFRKGVIASMTSGGRVIRTQCVYLDKPEASNSDGSAELPDGKLSKLNRLLVMKKFTDAYDCCLLSKDEEMYLALGRACLESMELDIAMKAYVAVNDIGMVYSIRRAMKNKDYSQCCGNVAVILGEFDLAEQKYLEAGLRIPALQMRRDLQEWDKALEMAQKFAPHLVADVSREYALYHEHNGEYAVALTLFEEAFNKFGDSKRPPRPTTAGGRALSSQLADARVLKQIEDGIARNSIRCGHIQKGFQMALDSTSTQQKKDCAAILEASKSYAEAGALYEDCKLWENAASCYIRMKNWNRVADLLQYIQSPKIFIQFGKAKEAEGKLREAAISYERANDVMNGIRLYLSADFPDDAIRVARTSGSLSGAMLVSRYFEEHGDMETALRFLIISRCYEDALLVAFKHGKAETYVQCIQDEFPNGVPSEFLDGIRQVAAYFEEKKDNFKAGKYYQVCEDYKKSFTLLMKAAQNRVTVDDNELMEVIIQTVIKSDNEAYSRALVEFLLGENDSVPKDPKFLLSYYISSKKLVEASKTAIIVAMDDQKAGNYRDAHSTLVRTCKELKAHSMKIPKDIMDALKILHYYLLVRKHVNIQNHKQAARLLAVIVDNISKFSAHTVQLLTTAVVECNKAGLHKSCMQCCFTLMKPDFRKQIPEKFKLKIETMVRKSGKSKQEDVQDDTSPCPYCQASVPDYTLVCVECKSEIPFCIASGRHIFAGDFTTCPKCEFPAIRSELLRLLENEPVCPLCSESLSKTEVNLINDLHPYLFVTRTG